MFDSLGTTLGGIIGSLFGGSDYSGGGIDTLKDTGSYLQNMYENAAKAISPYYMIGGYGMGKYLKALNQYSDPTKLYSNIMSSYSESPSAQFQESEGMNTLSNYLESQGLSGSGAAAKDVLKYSQGLASEDQEQYLKDVLGLGSTYLSGLSGLGQTGYNAASTLGNYAMQSGSQYSQLQQALANAQAEAEAAKSSSSTGLGAAIGSLL